MLLCALLDAKDLPEGWHRSYGLTDARLNALTYLPASGASYRASYRDSFLNPKSETALTLFFLGRLDNWTQARLPWTLPRLPPVDLPPRHKGHPNSWNQDFFDAVRAGPREFEPFRREHEPTPLMSRIARLVNCDPKDIRYAVLLFEFELSNASFHSGSSFDKLSFLDIRQKWSQFDAVVVLPERRHLVFFEAKLTEDISRGTTEYPYINQVIRNLEGAYFLTRLSPLYQGWDFNYVFICPDMCFRFQTAYYSCLLRDLPNHVELYRGLLLDYYRKELATDRFGKYFWDFAKVVPSRVSVWHWNELGCVLAADGEYFDDYLNAIEKLGEQAGEATRKRLELAGVLENG